MNNRRMIIAGSTGIVLIVITILIIWLRTRPAIEASRTVVAARQDVVQDVTFTGRLAAQNSVDVAFEVTGLLEKLEVAVGDTVHKGQELAQLDTRIARLEATQKQADRASGQYTARVTWQNALRAVEVTKGANDTTTAKARQAVRDAKNEFDHSQDVFLATERENGSESAVTKTAQATMTAKQTSYHTAQRTLEETLKTTSQTAQTATDASRLAEAQYLATTQTGPSIAGLSSLETSEEIKDILLTKSTLLAPIDGVITGKNMDPGEIAVANQPIVTIATTDQLEIVAQVAEIDATKVAPGMDATITFDAFTTAEQWPATVTSVAPAAVVIDGVPTYEIQLVLTKTPPAMAKPGLTTNVTVHTAQAQQVIAVPRRAVITQGKRQFVRIMTDTSPREQDVTTGLLGSDGTIEITSGLHGDELVIISLVTE